MKELYNNIDNYLNKLGECNVSRFYSDSNQITVTASKNICRTDIEKIMKNFGYKLYTSGSNDNYIMYTFK